MKLSKKFKTAIAIWFGIYPTINLLFFILEKYIEHLPILVKTLIISLILVPFMVFIWFPLIQKFLYKWLNKG